MVQRRKVVIIGVDGGTFDLIKPWVAQGHLPNFERLMAEGCHAVLKCPTAAPLSPASWSSFATGLTPAHHSILDFAKLSSRSYGRTIQTSRMRRGGTFWDYLTGLGRTVGISEVPLTYPPDEVNGFMVSGHPAPIEKRVFTYPEGLQRDLLEAVPDFVSSTAETVRAHRSGTDKYAQFAEGLHRMVETRVRSGLWLFDRFQSDLFCHVLVAPDWASHYYWHFMDLESPYDISSEDRERYGTVILDMYKAADRFIGEILGRIDDDTLLFVVSDHGFCQTYATFNMRQWLTDRGLLTFAEAEKNGWSGLQGRVARRLKRALPAGVANWIKSRFPRAAALAGRIGRIFQVDFSRTKAYPVGMQSHIYINLRGRQPNGIVEPGQEYEQIRTRLIKDLGELRNPRTGSKVIKKVYRREELMAGPFLEEAPDLLIEWADHTLALAGLGTGPGPLFSDVDVSASRWQRTANHDPKGILIACGKGIEAGRELPDCSIVDVLPSVMYAIGAPVPEGLDGRILDELFTEAFRASNPVSFFRPDTQAPKADAEVFTGEENKEVAEHLRGLGYIE